MTNEKLTIINVTANAPSLKPVYDFVYKGQRVARAVEDISPDIFTLEVFVPRGVKHLRGVQIVTESIEQGLLKQVRLILGMAAEPQRELTAIGKSGLMEFMDLIQEIPEDSEKLVDIPIDTVVTAQFYYRIYLREMIEMVKLAIDGAPTRDANFMAGRCRIGAYKNLKALIAKHNPMYDFFPTTFAKDLVDELECLIKHPSLTWETERSQQLISYARMYPTKLGGWTIPFGKEPTATQIIVNRLDNGVGCPNCGSPFYKLIPTDQPIEKLADVEFKCDLCLLHWTNDPKAYNYSVPYDIERHIEIDDFVLTFWQGRDEYGWICVDITRPDDQNTVIAVAKLNLRNRTERLIRMDYNVLGASYKTEVKHFDESIPILNVLRSVTSQVSIFLGENPNVPSGMVREFLSRLNSIAGQLKISSIPGGQNTVIKLQFLIRAVLAYIEEYFKQVYEQATSKHTYPIMTDEVHRVKEHFLTIQHRLIDPRTNCTGIIPEGYVDKWITSINDLLEKIRVLEEHNDSYFGEFWSNIAIEWEDMKAYALSKYRIEKNTRFISNNKSIFFCIKGENSPSGALEITKHENGVLLEAIDCRKAVAKKSYIKVFPKETRISTILGKFMPNHLAKEMGGDSLFPRGLDLPKCINSLIAADGVSLQEMTNFGWRPTLLDYPTLMKTNNKKEEPNDSDNK